ncbi:MAG TPA: 16S rRNA (cytosine(1402)-N(4))-methyltransferase RsmH [Candidatus Sulfotelmatobacter sp.]|nr:16S rRNA (cytosine(1402)-N(4))-methyltransferase RsmH [Candidatus Sulfotelmatobacter sp.]
MSNYHRSVLLKEVIDLLKVKKGEKIIDATLGGSGHTKAFLEKGAKVLGIDLDEDAIEHTKKSLGENKNLILVKGNFRDLDKIAHLNNFDKVAGVLFDLGVSSHQMDTPERGFSFLKGGPLDMRMDKSSGVTAEALVNLLEKGELNDIFNKFGQERRSRVISNSIVRARRIRAIKTTGDLAGIIQQAYGVKKEDINEFTKNLINKRVFQALRIAVNEEIENIKEALPKAYGVLGKGGRIAVISFHSLEDGVVKNTFKDFEKKNMGKVIIKKPIEVSKRELNANPRAASAKLRVFEKN